MSLPAFSGQSELFSTAALSGTLFPEDDRYRLFGKLIYPQVAGERPGLEKCYCADNGRTAVEPVLLLGVSLLQELDGMPDRLAVEMLRYHAGWNFALNRQLGDPLFHPTTLVNFRNRLEEHDLTALGFTTILKALEKAGLISRQSRQRLDSTQMFGRVARMSRLDCVRESLRLTLQELEPAIGPAVRPAFWIALWDRYVESQADYGASSETLARKLAEAGNDAWQLLEWLRTPALCPCHAKPQAQLLARVFEEQFQIVAGAETCQGQLFLGAGDGVARAVRDRGYPDRRSVTAHRVPASRRVDVGTVDGLIVLQEPDPSKPVKPPTPLAKALQDVLSNSLFPVTRAKSTRARSDLFGQGQGREKERARGLQGADCRNRLRSDFGSGRTDAQFYRWHRNASGL